MIKAFNEILKEYSNLKLVILGEGEERKEIEKLIKKLGLNKSIYLQGYKKIFLITCIIVNVIFRRLFTKIQVLV